MNSAQLKKEIQSALRKEKFNVSENGVVSMFNDSLLAQGEYIEGVNGKDWRAHKNLLVDQGIVHILNVVFGSTSKISTWYLAPFSGSSAPAAGWTAANVVSNATEITSTTEGYTETPRQTVTFVNATSSDQIDNYASKCAFTIATATSLTITGLFLSSVATRGGTTGTLISATKFTTARVLQNGDSWLAGYRVVLASS